MLVKEEGGEARSVPIGLEFMLQVPTSGEEAYSQLTQLLEAAKVRAPPILFASQVRSGWAELDTRRHLALTIVAGQRLGYKSTMTVYARATQVFTLPRYTVHTTYCITFAFRLVALC